MTYYGILMKTKYLNGKDFSGHTKILVVAVLLPSFKSVKTDVIAGFNFDDIAVERKS